MSEVTVLDIPLQNSLTPRVGTYSGEGRSDTTFVYDSELNDYSLHAVNNTSTGYYFYYPEIPLIAGNDIYLEFDFKATNYSGSYMPIISLNRSSSANSNVPILIEQDGRDINIHWNQSRPASIRVNYNEWHHCKFGLWVDTSNNSTYYILRINSEIRTSANSNATVITDLTVLGNTTNNSSPSNVYIKNVKVKTNITSFSTILIHAGNEILKAYSPLPDDFASAIKAKISFKGIVDGDITPTLMDADSDPYNQYLIPDQYNPNLITEFNSGHSYYDRGSNPSRYYSFHYDESFRDYVYEKLAAGDASGHSTSMWIRTSNTGYFNLANPETKLCIEFTKSILTWQTSPYTAPNYRIYLIDITPDNPPLKRPSYFSLRIYCTNTGAIVDNQGNSLSGTHSQEALNIELNTPYKFTIYLEFKPIKRRVICKVFINDNLRYTGDFNQDSLRLGTDCSFNFYYGAYSTYDSTLFKLGTINIYSGYPTVWHSKLNVKHNNNLYYLLASNTGLYPSRLRAKINGITYPILLKHDEDNV